MASVWPKLAEMHFNAVLVPVYWELVEREEGRFDFSSVDSSIADARRYDMRLVLLWFGRWKNSMSSYVPAWVKRTVDRFPRAQQSDGKPLEILSAATTRIKAGSCASRPASSLSVDFGSTAITEATQ